MSLLKKTIIKILELFIKVYEEIVRTKKKPCEIRKILFINLFGIGDVMLSTPTIRCFKKKFPEAELFFLVKPLAKGVVANNPNLKKVFVYKNFFDAIKMLKKENFDMGIALTRSPINSFLLIFSRSKSRIGHLYDYTVRSNNYPIKREVWRSEHLVDLGLKIAKAVDCKTDRKTEIHITKEDRVFARNFLKNNDLKKSDLIVAINPDAKLPLKRWPVQNFITVTYWLIKNKNAKIILTGSKNDLETCEKIRNAIGKNVFIAAGKTTLSQLAAIVKECDLFLTCDSGPMHIAMAIGIPTLALFGPTNPKTIFLSNKNSSYIYKPINSKAYFQIGKKEFYNLSKKYADCMKIITVEEVTEELKKMLK